MYAWKWSCHIKVQSKSSGERSILRSQEQSKIGTQSLLVVILPQAFTFFDWFARSPKHYGMNKYLDKMKRQVVVNEMVLQGPLSNACGKFFMFFGCFLCCGWRLADILKYFNEDLSFNEKAMFLQVQKLFPDHCRTFIYLLYINFCIVLPEKIHKNQTTKNCLSLNIINEWYNNSKFTTITIIHTTKTPASRIRANILEK